MKLFLTFAALVAVAVAGRVPANQQHSVQQRQAAASGNIPQSLVANGFTTLADFAGKAGLIEVLSGPGPFTVFAPTNAAFAALSPELVQKLSADPELLRSVLTYHVVPGKVLSSALQNELVANSVQGSPLRFNFYKTGSNVFPTVEGVQISSTDIAATNGVIHVIDTVLTSTPKGSIVGVLANDPRFSTLVTAVKAAGLVETLDKAGPFTVFAPTNEAFSALPAGVLNDLLANPEELKKVLLGHVVSGSFFSRGLQSGIVPTVKGTNARINLSRSGVQVESANVIQADISATNGVIHVINRVI